MVIRLGWGHLPTNINCEINTRFVAGDPGQSRPVAEPPEHPRRQRRWSNPHACPTVPVDPPAVFTGDGETTGAPRRRFHGDGCATCRCDNRLRQLCWELPHFGRRQVSRLPEQPGSSGHNFRWSRWARCCQCVGEQRQDSAVEVGCSAIRLVQGAVDSAEMVLVGAAPGDGLFPVAGRVGGWRWRDRCRVGCCSSGVCGSTRWTAPGPVVLPRARGVNCQISWFWLKFRDPG